MLEVLYVLTAGEHRKEVICGALLGKQAEYWTSTEMAALAAESRASMSLGRQFEVFEIEADIHTIKSQLSSRFQKFNLFICYST